VKFTKSINFLEKREEKQIVVGVVYEPDVRDAQGDWASAEDIENACHKFMMHYQNVSIQHKYLVNDKVKIVENYIAPSDFILNGERIRKVFWIIVCKFLDPKIWQSIKSGELNGFSLGGHIFREKDEA